jgi:hypothetical protein
MHVKVLNTYDAFLQTKQNMKLSNVYDVSRAFTNLGWPEKYISGIL